jgi:catechol 2,3-dioxygenase-like lactoylglutathione lyase family enzyme
MMKLSSVAVVVRDAQKAAAWWKDKVGFEVRANEGHWVSVGAKGSPVVLHMCETRPLERGNTGFGFVATNVRKETSRLKRNGVRITKGPITAPWGTSARFADPDGNEFWINEA